MTQRMRANHLLRYLGAHNEVHDRRETCDYLEPPCVSVAAFAPGDRVRHLGGTVCGSVTHLADAWSRTVLVKWDDVDEYVAMTRIDALELVEAAKPPELL